MLLDANRTLKIADFGVARVEAQNPRDMTGETGTLGYMAPEVLLLIDDGGYVWLTLLILCKCVLIRRYLCRSLMVNLIIENAMFTALAFVYGKPIVVICLFLISALLKFPLQLSDRLVLFV